MTETEPTRMPNFWWSPTSGLWRGGDERPCADAVKLGDVETSREEPRVFFPGDTVPAGVATAVAGERIGSGDRHVFVMHEVSWPWRAKEASVELLRPSPEEFDAIVDRARSARDEAPPTSPAATAPEAS